MRIGTMWIAFNRVSRWPLLFSRKNHHNETASLPVSVPSLSPREKISRRRGTLRNELSLLPFLTRFFDYFGWVDGSAGGEILRRCLRFLEMERRSRSVLIVMNWGGEERERCLEFRLFIGSVLDYFHRDILNGFLEISRNLRFFPLSN